uniref:Uncharacterized protein n=1 Tax=Anguilla anguilla TaxID=7936 RepID=A0A0E9X742_ANGAN
MYIIIWVGEVLTNSEKQVGGGEAKKERKKVPSVSLLKMGAQRTCQFFGGSLLHAGELQHNTEKTTTACPLKHS